MKLLVLILSCSLICNTINTFDWDKFLNALQKIEVGNSLKPDLEVGDEGKAIGRYQIHYEYWLDATNHDKSIGGKYEDCHKRDYSIKIVKAYMLRYGREFIRKNNVEFLARIHNGGPNGHKKQATANYGKKFMRIYNGGL